MLSKSKSDQLKHKQSSGNQNIMTNLPKLKANRCGRWPQTPGKEESTLPRKRESTSTWPPERSKTASFPSEIAFKPIFHHLSLCSAVLPSTVDTSLSGTGSIAATGSPNKCKHPVSDSWICGLAHKLTDREGERKREASPWDLMEHRMIRSILERSKL